MIKPSRIALVGFMGSGKSTVGRLIADRLSYRFFDSDEVVESRAQVTVSEIFRSQGEAVFREWERQVILDLMTEENCVVATGGGAFTQATCAEVLLSRALTVFLACDFDEAFRRAALRGGRPLVEKGESEARALYAERKDKYSRAHLTVDATHRSPAEVAADVFRLLPHS